MVQSGVVPPTAVPRLPTHHRLAMYGVMALTVGLLVATLFSSLGPGTEAGPVFSVYAAVLGVAGVGLLLAALVVRLRRGPAGSGPYWTDADRVENRIVVAGVAGAWAAPLLGAGSLAMVMGIVLLDKPATVGWFLLAVGLALAGLGVTLTWRDERRQGRDALPLLLMGFGFAAVSFAVVMAVGLGTAGAGMPAILVPPGLFTLGALVFTVGFVRRDPDPPVGPRRTGAFWAGFLLVLPLTAAGFGSVGAGEAGPGLSCVGRIVEVGNGGTNKTVQLSSTVVQLVDGRSSGTSGPFPAPEGTTKVLVRVVDGIDFRVEEQGADGGWRPAPGGGEDDQGEHQVFDRGDGTGALRVTASAGADRNGSSQDVEILFHRHVETQDCVEA